jgi:hypothetical protein
MSTMRESSGRARGAPPLVGPEVIAKHVADARALRSAHIRGLAVAAWRRARRLVARRSRAAWRAWGARTTM